MITLLQRRELIAILTSLGILLSSYLAARVLSFFFTRVLARLARRTTSGLDDVLVASLGRPVTAVLFLVGAVAAVHRLPAPPRLMDGLDAVLFVLAVLLSALLIVRGFRAFLGWYVTESRPAQQGGAAHEFAPLLGRVATVFVAVAAIITILQRFGVSVSSLLVSLGVGSLAIGLAAQDTLANLFAGFTLMLDRPFRVGDRVQLASGETGDVEVIGMRSTRLRTLDETLLVVPNSVLVKERLVNLALPTRRLTVRVEVGVAYGSDLREVKELLLASAQASPLVDADREPAVTVVRFADFAVIVVLVFWVRDYMDQALARSQVHEEIDRRFREAGIEIPFPVRRVIQEDAPAAARGRG
jgi:small-conductance mechanosensitive channel